MPVIRPTQVRASTTATVRKAARTATGRYSRRTTVLPARGGEGAGRTTARLQRNRRSDAVSEPGDRRARRPPPPHPPPPAPPPPSAAPPVTASAQYRSQPATPSAVPPS